MKNTLARQRQRRRNLYALIDIEMRYATYLESAKVLLNESNNIDLVKFNTLYHGTTLSKANEIVKFGFDIKKSGEKTNSASHSEGISFTYLKSEAKDHARWASEKFKDSPAIISVSSKNLKILSGTAFNSLAKTTKGCIDKSYQLFKNGIIDAVSFCDQESGDGCEEMEVLVFSLDKLDPTL